MSISRHIKKINPLAALAVILAFGLGICLIFLAIKSKNVGNTSFSKRTPVREAGLTPSVSPSRQKTVQKTIVASKTGKKYYFPGCSGVKRIKEANKISFESIELAEKAGYTVAANCSDTK